MVSRMVSFIHSHRDTFVLKTLNLYRFLSLPPVTRIWLGTTLAVTGLANLDLLSWNQLHFSRWEDVSGRGISGRPEVWRCVR